MRKQIQQSLPAHFQLLITLGVFLLLRLPSLFEPNWYGDEGIYQTIGLAMRHGRLLYTGIFDNKPPFLYITYALFSGNQFELRLLSLIVGLCTVTLFFCISKRIFVIPRLQFTLTLVFAILFGLPLIEGNIANAENFMLLPILGAISLLFLANEKTAGKERTKRQLYLFVSGVLLASATLFKIVGVFDTTACVLFLLITHIWYLRKTHSEKLAHTLRNLLHDLMPIFLGFVIPLLLTASYFALHHAFMPFLQATLLSNVGYVGYSNTFIIPQGLLILKLLILAVYILILVRKRKSLTTMMLFISLWLGFSIFNVFFSQRPYTHYALLVVPSLILAIGSMFSKERSAILTASALGALLLVGIHFGFYGNTFSYYGNFLSYLSGHKSTAAYQAFFDANTPRDYEVVSFLKTQRLTAQSLFVWGDSAEIYQLTGTIPPGRYTVAYHISQYKNAIPETTQALRTNPPEYIVVLPNTPRIPFRLNAYSPLVIVDNTTIYERTN